MAAQVSADVVATELEKVRPNIPVLYEREDTLITKLQKKGEVVSTRNARIPLQIRPGGRYGAFDPDGGDVGRGGGAKYEVATVTPSYFKFASEVTLKAEWGGDSKEKAVHNAVKAEILNSAKQFRSVRDKMLNRASTGVLGVYASGTTTITLAADSAFAASQKFYVGQGVLMAIEALSGFRNSGAASIISAIDDDANTITVNTAFTSATAGDLLVPEGSTIAGSALTQVFFYGIPYHHDDSTSATWLSLSRSTYPELRTPSVLAAGAPLNTGMVRLALDKVDMKLGLGASEETKAYMHNAQVAAWEELGINVSEIKKTASASEKMDLFFAPSTIAGREIIKSINADRTRIDFIHLPSWGRVVTKDVDLLEIGGRTVFPVYGTSGGIAAAYLWYTVCADQIFTENPAKGAFIESLAKPSGY